MTVLLIAVAASLLDRLTLKSMLHRSRRDSPRGPFQPPGAYRLFRQPWCEIPRTRPPPASTYSNPATAQTPPTNTLQPAPTTTPSPRMIRPIGQAATPGDPPPAHANSWPRAAPPRRHRATRAEYLVLNLRAYPAWMISLNHQPDLIRPHRQRRPGQSRLPSPPGHLNHRHSLRAHPRPERRRSGHSAWIGASGLRLPIGL